jgi:putative heme iron utilization protein
MESAVVFEEKTKKAGRPRKGHVFEIHAYHSVDGRMKLEKVAGIEAVTKKIATMKAENFCAAFGYDFSHLSLES